uniref:Uncharacterized protein n=1 Tax=Anguilla anguilla TaxID=7936 RepID=A0A0E9WSE8_ANGAN
MSPCKLTVFVCNYYAQFYLCCQYSLSIHAQSSAARDFQKFKVHQSLTENHKFSLKNTSDKNTNCTIHFSSTFWTLFIFFLAVHYQKDIWSVIHLYK